MRISRISWLALAVATALAAGSCEDAAEPDDPGTATVSMPGFSFTPFTTTIAVGESVVFDFPAESHNVIFARVAGAPADIQETVKTKVSRTFQVAGSFAYDCTIHPGMSGVVVAR